MLCFQNVLFLFTESSRVKTNHPRNIFSLLISSLDRSIAPKSLNNQGQKSCRDHILKVVDCTDPMLLIPGQVMGSFCHDLKHCILFTPIFMGVCKLGKAFPCLLTPCFSLAKPAMIIQQVLNNLVTEKERILYFQVTGMNKLPDLGNH